MKLKEGFVTCQDGDTQLMVAAGRAQQEFSGLCRSNKTAAFIVDMLKNDVTIEDIVDAMYQKYDAPRDKIESDVNAVIEKLKSINAIE